MRTTKRADEEREIAPLPTWISGTVTVYPRYGKPRKVSFPCTWEYQLLLQRLEQEQEGDRQAR